MAKNRVSVDGDIIQAERRQRVAKRLLELEDQFGQLTPQIVVDDAKNPDSPLHDSFEWSIQEAAERYWLMQARTLIRSVRYTSSNETTTVNIPMYLRNPAMANGVQGYTSVPRLLTQPEMARRALAAELDRTRSILLRATGYAVTLNLIEALQALMNDVDALVERVSPPKLDG